jgi:hypothetical protein
VSKTTLFAVSRGSFFFECACFWIFVILSAQTLHCGFNFESFWGALGLSKNSWKCVSVVNFRGLTPLKSVFSQVLIVSAFLSWFFTEIYDFQWFWGVNFLYFWEQSSWKKKVLKTGTRGTSGNLSNGGEGPLKQAKQAARSSDNQTMPQTRPGVPIGTVADIYI